MRLDLFEFETVLDGGEGAAPADPIAEAPAEPVAEAETPEAPAAEPEAWSGPTREEWQQTQADLAQAREVAQLLNQPAPAEPAEPPALPDYDPFDPESAQAYFEARDQRLLDGLQGMLSPILEERQNANAQAWVDQTFEKLGVPEAEHWREGVLIASPTYQQLDAQGRPTVNPQVAAQQSYEFLQKFAKAEREAALVEYKATQEADAAALKARVDSPVVPVGPSGGEGVPEGIDELAAARMWRTKEAAAAV